MRYCSECGSEYQDSATACSDDPGAPLLSADEMRARGLQMQTERDTRRFVRVGSAEDPLTAEAFVRALQERGIPVMSRTRHGGTADVITSGVNHPWWEVLVPDTHADLAARTIVEERARLDAEGPEAEAAAEAEALGGADTSAAPR